MKKHLMTILLCLVLVPSIGCLKKKYPDVRLHSLELERSADSQSSSSGIVLQVRKLGLSPRYESPYFIYRTGNFSYETDFYNRFITSKASMFTELVANWLRHSPKIKDVVDNTSSIDAAYVLEGEVNEFYGDYRDEAAPQAVLKVQLALIKKEGAERKVIFKKVYSQQIHFKPIAVQGLLESWNKALQKIMLSFDDDLRRQL